MAEKLNLQRPWPEVKEKLKEHNIELTDEDLQYSPGQEEELFKKLQQKLKKTPEEIKAYIESVSSNAGKAS